MAVTLNINKKSKLKDADGVYIFDKPMVINNTVSGGIIPAVGDGNYTLSADKWGGDIIYFTAPGNISIPDASTIRDGGIVNIKFIGTGEVIITPHNTDRIRLADLTALDDGAAIKNTVTAGEIITLHKDSVSGFSILFVVLSGVGWEENIVEE